MFRLLKVAWSCRRLFKNWFSAGLKYFLLVKICKKRALITVKCKDGSILHLPSSVFRNLINGFADHIIQRLSCREGKAWINDIPIPLSELEAGSIHVINLAIKCS